MKVEMQDIESCVKKLSIEVPIDRVNKEKSSVYEELAKTANIPGFRKGKVPRKMLEKRFGPSALQEAAQKIIQDAYREAIETNNLHPVGDPMVDEITVEEDKPITFTATVETFPEVTLGELDGLTMKKQIKEITDFEVNKSLEEFREQTARFEPVEGRPVKDGDYPLLDYSATKGGEPVELFQGKNKQALISKSDLLSGFHTNIIGMNKGEEKVFEVTLPKEFPQPDMAGEKLEFTVKVNEIKAKILPELDDDFAREVSQFDTIAEMKEDIRSNLSKSNSQAADNKFREELLTYMIEHNPFDLPPKLIDRQAEALAAETERRYQSQGGDMSQVDQSKFKDIYRGDAIRELKEQVIVNAYAKAKKVEVGEADINKEIEELALMMGQTAEDVKGRIAQSNGIASLFQKVLTDKVYDAMIAQLTIEEEIAKEENEK